MLKLFVVNRMTTQTQTTKLAVNISTNIMTSWDQQSTKITFHVTVTSTHNTRFHTSYLNLFHHWLTLNVWLCVRICNCKNNLMVHRQMIVSCHRTTSLFIHHLFTHHTTPTITQTSSKHSRLHHSNMCRKIETLEFCDAFCGVAVRVTSCKNTLSFHLFCHYDAFTHTITWCIHIVQPISLLMCCFLCDFTEIYILFGGQLDCCVRCAHNCHRWYT